MARDIFGADISGGARKTERSEFLLLFGAGMK
jgi:hypothetical protein